MLKKLLIMCILLISTISYSSRMAEIEYLEKISQYHKLGIEKSKLALDKTKNSDIKKLASKIIKTQVKEQRQLHKLLALLYSDAGPLKDNTIKLNSNDLEKLPGNIFDKKYLELIEENHKTEILITSKMLPELSTNDVHHLAVKIIKEKGNELDRIEKIKKKF